MRNNIDRNNTVLFLTLGWAILLLPLIMFCPSCKNHDVSVEIRQVDTLAGWLDQAKGFRVIDESLIESRIDSMDKKIRFVKSLDTVRMNAEFKFDADKYQGMYNNYKLFLEDYAVLNFNQKELELKIANLKKGLIDGSVSKQYYDRQYPELKSEVKLHLSTTNSLVRQVLSFEKMYQRINNKITRFYQKQTQGQAQ